MNAKFESLTVVAKPRRRTKTANIRRRFLAVEHMEERTLLSTSPIRIGSLGDSLTDEYAFYAPYRPAAQNWVQILSGSEARKRPTNSPSALTPIPSPGARRATTAMPRTGRAAAPPQSGPTSSERRRPWSTSTMAGIWASPFLSHRDC